MKNNKLVLCFLLLVLGCKCKDEEVPTLYLSQESKDYCLYQPGSWWVYQSEQSLAYDTLKITGIRNEIIFSKNSNLNTESNTLTIEQKKLLPEALNKLERGPVESYYGLILNGGVGIDLYFDRPSYRNDSISVLTTVAFMKYFDSIQFNSTYYYSVKEFVSTRFREYKNIYWAKHIGIIKLEKPDGEIWNLINYSVIQ